MQKKKKKKGNIAFCLICDENENNEFVCNRGTTGSIGRHLMAIHSMSSSTTEKRR